MTDSVTGNQARWNRRRILQTALGAAIGLPLGKYAWDHSGSDRVPDIHLSAASRNDSRRQNFRSIYQDAELRERFKLFLTNVFHLYPEDEMDALIAKYAGPHASDEEVYAKVAANLAKITPFLSEVRYAVPALEKQKSEMRRQTAALLDKSRSYEGYLEIGSHGRYLSALQDQLNIGGPIFTSTPMAPTYSPQDLIDREQIAFMGTHINMDDYDPVPSQTIPHGSLDLVTVYIGFHHCPLQKRQAYIESIRDTLTAKGTMILRDHNVDSQDMEHMVALAHDVFNLGTGQSWEYNRSELRHFYPLSFIVSYLEEHGFKFEGQRLLQHGDPTRNTLMHFQKA